MWVMFLHNKNHMLFGDSESYGSSWISLSTTDFELGKGNILVGFTFALSVDIVKKKMDKEENYCHDTLNERVFDMDKCLGEFYAQSTGCLSPWEHVSPLNYPPCLNNSQYEGIFFVC